MIEYKDAEFYSDYFKSLDGFSIIEEFKESKEDDEKKLFVGYVEVLNTIHPLIVRVEIPFTFPHNKLTFRTKSISGYPHLIHSGKTKHGDWFCLNTPFAETVEESIVVNCQQNSGKCRTKWRLFNASGLPFGDVLELELNLC